MQGCFGTFKFKGEGNTHTNTLKGNYIYGFMINTVKHCNNYVVKIQTIRINDKCYIFCQCRIRKSEISKGYFIIELNILHIKLK